ncbi:MAG: carbohydrate ABC transporter permease [Chloroflexi bacterium]|nr:carbohydrate ABC transporter permease [Chloroflexota bacterium]
MQVPLTSAFGRRTNPIAILIWAVGLVVAVAWAAPLVWMVSTSVKPPGEVMTKNIEWLPRTVTLDNYRKVLEKPVLRWLINSVIVAVSATVTSVLTGSMAGYALARLHFPGRNVLFIGVLAALMIPTEMTIVPLFIGFLKAGLANNLLAMILPSLANVFSVYLFRQFFLTLPRELEDAAAIDGASRFRIFWAIALPLSKPALIAATILLFTAYWNAFLWPLLIAFKDEMKTLPVGMAAYAPNIGSYTQIEGFAPAMAAMTILSVPSIVAFLILQRHFMEGATRIGIRG